MMKINLSSDALPRLFTDARRRRLTVTGDDGIYFVGSYSVPGLHHKVVIEGDEATCTCAATAACTHVALAAAESSLTLWREFFNAECDRFAEKRLRAQQRLQTKVIERHQKAMCGLIAA